MAQINLSNNSPIVVIREIGQPKVEDFEATSARFRIIDEAIKSVSRIIITVWRDIAQVVNNNANNILADVQANMIKTGSAAPTANANFVGQTFIDTTNDDGYVAINTGTGASDWKKTTP